MVERKELPKIEIQMADDIFVKLMKCEHADMLVEQHVHKYDHITVFASGSFRVWEEGQPSAKDLVAPTSIIIPAGKKHMFLSLEPNSLALCIHNISRAGEPEIIPTESLLKDI